MYDELDYSDVHLHSEKNTSSLFIWQMTGEPAKEV